MDIKENYEKVEDFMKLYDSVGWGAYDKTISEKMLKANLYSVSIYDNDDIIAYGRIIGDGISFIYIHDVMVKKEEQGKSYGTKIMNKLLEKVNDIKKENEDVRVYLGASKGKEGFYEKFGFISRKEADLGEGMILK